MVSIIELLTNAIESKIESTIVHGIDYALDRLTNQIFPSINFNDIESFLTDKCEVVYVINDTVKSKDNLFYIIGLNDDIGDLDVILKLKNQDIYLRFLYSVKVANESSALKEVVKGLYTTFFWKELLEKEYANYIEENKQEEIRISINDLTTNDDDTIKFTVEEYKKKHVKSLFIDVTNYNTQIKKCLDKLDQCVVFLYGEPGNQKSTYIKNLFYEFHYLDNYPSIYNGIPPRIYNGITIIEDVDRYIESLEETALGLTLSRFFNQLDGTQDFIEEGQKRLIIITANDLTKLPDALLNRRFDLQIRFDNPSLDKRQEILETYLTPERAKLVVDALESILELSVSTLLKLAKNLNFLEIEDIEAFKNVIIPQFNQLKI